MMINANALTEFLCGFKYLPSIVPTESLTSAQIPKTFI